jgi:hypothetical protein
VEKFSELSKVRGAVYKWGEYQRHGILPEIRKHARFDIWSGCGRDCDREAMLTHGPNILDCFSDTEPAALLSTTALGGYRDPLITAAPCILISHGGQKVKIAHRPCVATGKK